MPLLLYKQLEEGLDSTHHTREVFLPNAHHLAHRFEVITNHNEALSKLFTQRQTAIAALAQKDREALREAV